jgi:tetratricopeptide (TPR) repeat protein
VDLDADGRNDLVTVLAGGNRSSADGVLSWTLASEGFQRFLPISNLTPTRPQLVDVNRDGFLDVALVVSNALAFVLGDQSGNIGVVILAPEAQPIRSVDVAHINRDGIPDFLVRADAIVDPTDGTVIMPGGLLVRLGSGNFSPGAPRHTGLSVKGAIAAGDFNGDGNTDIVEVIGKGLGALALGDGQGNFTVVELPKGSDFRAHAAMHAADLNADGIDDLVSASFGSIVLVEGSLVDGFGPSQVLFSFDDAEIQWFDVEDVDRDGDLDVVVSYADAINPPQIAIAEFVDGEFATAQEAAIGGAVGMYPVLGDLNGDRLLDIVATSKGHAVVFPGLPTLSDYHRALVDIASYVREIKDLLSQIKSLQEELKVTRGNLTDTQAQLRQALDGNATLQQANGNLTSTVAILTKQVTTLNDKIGSLQTQIGEQTKALGELSLALDESQKREQALKTELAIARNMTAAVTLELATARNTTAVLTTQLSISRNETSSLAQIILGGGTDRAAAEALYRQAASLVAFVKGALPRDKKIADAEEALQRALAALNAGDYARAAKESERAYDIAKSIADKNKLPLNITPAGPTIKK